MNNIGGGNYLYNLISYYIYNNYKIKEKISYEIANILLKATIQNPYITINNNAGESILINLMDKIIFKMENRLEMQKYQ